MDEEIAITKIKNLSDVAIRLSSLSGRNQDFKKWNRDSRVTIEKIFGSESSHLKEFNDIRYTPRVVMSGMDASHGISVYKTGVQSAVTLFASFIDEINEYGFGEKSSVSEAKNDSTIFKIELIIDGFHKVSRQLRERYSERETLNIEDEYDVQDLFHALLKIYFNDIRPEDYSPSYGGSSSRVDFLLKQENTVIEIKKTRKNLSAKELGEQLIIDIARYQVHPDCKHLVCFVYDPEARIANPKGIENDLSDITGEMKVSVFIRPY